MDIKEIIKTYGKVDYYEMRTGRIFKLSEMKYDEKNDETIIPVNIDGDTYNVIKVPGDATKLV